MFTRLGRAASLFNSGRSGANFLKRSFRYLIPPIKNLSGKRLTLSQKNRDSFPLTCPQRSLSNVYIAKKRVFLILLFSSLGVNLCRINIWPHPPPPSLSPFPKSLSPTLSFPSFLDLSRLLDPYSRLFASDRTSHPSQSLWEICWNFIFFLFSHLECVGGCRV